MASNVYHFERDTFEYQMKEFAAREIRFRNRHLGQSMSQIARMASDGDDAISPQTVSNLANGKTKHPQARTLFSILLALGFEFDMVQSELRETSKPQIDEKGKVIPISVRG